MPENEETMEYLYGLKWQPRQRHPIRELTEDKARAVFDTGPQLGVSAVPQPGGVPAYSLEMSAGARDVAVTEYTAEGSVAARMHYVMLGDQDRLFLQQVSEWLYPDDGTYHGMGRDRAPAVLLRT